MNKIMPREKAAKYGISSLDDHELLALILKTGYADKSVFELSEDILEKANGIENLCSFDIEELTSIKGLGTAKAYEILAIIEIYKRLTKVEKVSEEVMTSPKNIVSWIRFNIAFSNQEEFFVLYISTRGSIIKSEVLFKGTKTSSLVSVDEVIRRAVLLRADSLVVAHNHPSGNPQPSKEDIEITKRLSGCLKMMDLRLLDHIVVTRNDYFSFRSAGLLT